MQRKKKNELVARLLFFGEIAFCPTCVSNKLENIKCVFLLQKYEGWSSIPYQYLSMAISGTQFKIYKFLIADDIIQSLR